MEDAPDILTSDQIRPVAPRAPEPRRHVTLWGISYTLNVEPTTLSGAFFPCRLCTRPIFDGGIPRISQCSCGGVFIRQENLAVVSAEPAAMDSFDDLFKVRIATPPQGEIPILRSVTFGVFEEAGMNPDTALRSILLPFILFRERCFGINDLLEASGVRFKVLSAEPPYGVARLHTRVQCYTSLQTVPITTIKIAAIYPVAITPSLVQRLVTPYLRTQFRHIHLSKGYSDQYIYTPEGQFVVVRATPESGFVGDWTAVETDPRPLEGLYTAVFHPNFASFPRDFHQIPPQQLQSLLLDGYIRPYYLGWYRPVRPNEPVRIGGLEFTASQESLGFGFIGARTGVNVALVVQPQIVVQSTPDVVFLSHMWRLTHAIYPGVVVAPVTTSPAVLRDLPIRTLTSARLPSELQSCTVCLSDFQVGETLKTLPCCTPHTVHEFHANCIDHWLGRSQLCPLCKANVCEGFVRTQQT